MAKNLLDLPVEIIHMILEAAPPIDLFHLALTSRYYYEVYSTVRTRILVQSLRNAIPQQIWSEFCAAQFLLANFHPILDRTYIAITDDIIKVQAFLDQYFSSSVFELSTTDNDIGIACKLYSTISYFVDDLCQRALSEASHVLQPPSREAFTSTEMVTLGGQNNKIVISISERYRLFRSFLRFEIYTRLFRPAQTYNEITNYDGDTQFRHFLQRLTPWEVEEITCVHQYFADIIGHTINEMCQEFKDQVYFLLTQAANQNDDQTLVDLSRQYSNWFYYFSAKFRQDGTRSISSLTSSGLFSILKLARGEKTARFLFLRRICQCAMISSPFLAEALESSTLANPFTGSLQLASTQEYDNTNLKQANPGYAHLKPEPGYLAVEGGARQILYRRLGYIFWDSRRIKSQTLQTAFHIIATSNHPYITIGLAEGDSPEEQLGPVWLPGNYLGELIYAFKPIF